MGMIPYRNLGRFLNKAFAQPGYASRVFLKRSGALFHHALGSRRVPGPEAVTIFLTHRCNLRCIMCGQWGESGVTRSEPAGSVRQELSEGQLKSLVDDLAPLRPSVTLFGGEPLLHPACVKTIEHIKRKRMHCLMITNGSLLKQNAAALVASGLDELNVSIDGGRELHDRIRGLPGLFDTIIAGIAEVQRIKKEKTLSRPLVNLQCTISKSNYGRLEEMLEVARMTEADSLTYHNLIFLGKDVMERQKEIDALLECSSRQWEGFVSEPGIDALTLVRKIREVREGAKGTQREGKRWCASVRRRSVDVYPNFSEKEQTRYYSDPSFVPSEYPRRCLSPWLVAYVFPDGSVRPCLNLSYSFGTIKETSFSSVWNSVAASRFRGLLRKRGMFPACCRCTELYRY